MKIGVFCWGSYGDSFEPVTVIERIKPSLPNLVNYAHMAPPAAFSRSTGSPLWGRALFDLPVMGSFLVPQQKVECGSLIIKSPMLAMYVKSRTLNKPDGLDLASAVCRIP